ncbi:hypothetical protein CS542_02695 [Pedobacter sp. IW39]|nr:hypothetical protein CS542_02695 [Pedobacter sp. IW39]
MIQYVFHAFAASITKDQRMGFFKYGLRDPGPYASVLNPLPGLPVFMLNRDTVHRTWLLPPDPAHSGKSSPTL